MTTTTTATLHRAFALLDSHDSSHTSSPSSCLPSSWSGPSACDISSWATSRAGPTRAVLSIYGNRIDVSSCSCSPPGQPLPRPTRDLGADLSFAVSIASLVISNSRKRTSIQASPNAFPASRVIASRPFGDTTPIEFIQVRQESHSSSWCSDIGDGSIVETD